MVTWIWFVHSVGEAQQRLSRALQAHTGLQEKLDFGLCEKLEMEHGNWPPYLSAWEPEEQERVWGGAKGKEVFWSCRKLKASSFLFCRGVAEGRIKTSQWIQPKKHTAGLGSVGNMFLLVAAFFTSSSLKLPKTPPFRSWSVQLYWIYIKLLW